MKKPNIFWHMIRWGFLSGTLLAMLYMSLLLFGHGLLSIIIFFVNPFDWIVGIIFGGLPGMILGLIDAVVLWALLRIPSGFSLYQDIEDAPQIAYPLTFFFTLTAGLWIMVSIFSYPTGLVGLKSGMLDLPDTILTDLLLYNAPVSLLIPPLIAACAATYAAHRYLLRLQRYYEQGGKEKRKGKPKHDMSRLLDKSADMIEDKKLVNLKEDSMTGPLP